MQFSISGLPGHPRPFEGTPPTPPSPPSLHSVNSACVIQSSPVCTWAAWTCLWVDLGFHPLLEPGTRIYTVSASLRQIYSYQLEKVVKMCPLCEAWGLAKEDGLRFAPACGLHAPGNSPRSPSSMKMFGRYVYPLPSHLPQPLCAHGHWVVIAAPLNRKGPATQLLAQPAASEAVWMVYQGRVIEQQPGCGCWDPPFRTAAEP